MAKSPSPAGIKILCPSLRTGQAELFAAESIKFRPAAYGLLLHGSRLLLGRSVFTHKWDIPGGAVEPWETLEQGLAREFYEETGVAVAPGGRIEFREGYIAFFHRPFHSLRFYYRVYGDVEAPLQPDPDEVELLAWVQLQDIDPDECAAGDYALIQKILATS